MLCLQANILCKLSSVQACLLHQKPTPPWLPKRPSEHRHRPSCALFPYKHAEKKPCFDISSTVVERARACHKRLIKSFLYAHYWPREPSMVGLYMPIDSPYLECLTDKYCNTGDRWMVSEELTRTKERKIVGLLVADKASPWSADEYERWAHQCCLKPERNNMCFRAHCLRSSNIFDRYHLPYAYNIEVLATSTEVTGQNVALLLLRSAIFHAIEQRHPIIQIYSKNHYTHKLCERCGMKPDWEMNYSDFIDMKGQKVFFPRHPHNKVILYTKHFDEKEGFVPEECFYPEVFALYKKQVLEKETIPNPSNARKCNKLFPLFPDCKN